MTPQEYADHIDAQLKCLSDNDQHLLAKIDKLTNRVRSLESEVDELRSDLKIIAGHVADVLGLLIPLDPVASEEVRAYVASPSKIVGLPLDGS